MFGPLVSVAVLFFGSAAVALDPTPVLVQEVRRLAATPPPTGMCATADSFPSSSCLVTSINSEGRLLQTQYPADRIHELSAAWGLPPAVTTQLSWILIADSVTFQSFSLVIRTNSRSGRLEEFIGAARRQNGVAHVAIVHVVANAQLRQHYAKVTTHPFCTTSYAKGQKITTCLGGGYAMANALLPDLTCKKILFYEHACRKGDTIHSFTQPRGVSDSEIGTIEQIMRASAHQKLSRLINQGRAMFAVQADALHLSASPSTEEADADWIDSIDAWESS